MMNEEKKLKLFGSGVLIGFAIGSLTVLVGIGIGLALRLI